jgi:hypothetical protein
MWSEIGELLKGPIDVPVAWIQAEPRDPMFQYAGHIFVEQMESAHTDRDEQSRL